MSERSLARTLVERHGRTFADQAGIRLSDKPSPLFRLLVLSLLLSARISSDIAVAAARELSRAGMRTPEKMRAATWQERVDALGRGHYRRYDEKTSTQLGEMADHVLEQHRGDLRRLHVPGDAEQVSRSLEEFKGIGPAGAAIFLREVQSVWTDLAPYVDPLAQQGAERLGLPQDPRALAGLVPSRDLAALVAGCVRAARSDEIVEDVRGAGD